MALNFNFDQVIFYQYFQSAICRNCNCKRKQHLKKPVRTGPLLYKHLMCQIRPGLTLEKIKRPGPETGMGKIKRIKFPEYWL